MSRLNYNHLRYFWAVAHEGNLTRAAAQLHITQSALSVQLKKLEEQLGQALFERRGRGLHLTEAGRIALDHADQIFATGDEMLGTLQHAGTTRNVLRVGALATLSRNFQIGFVRPLLGRGDVEVVLRSGGAAELVTALENLSLDVVLINQAPMRDALTPYVAHRLAEQQVSLIGTAKRIGNNPATDITSLLQAHPVVLPTPHSSIRTGFDALAARLGVRPQIAAEVDDMALMRLLAREDVGLAVVPPIAVKDELASGILLQVADLPDISETFYAVTMERRFPNPLLSKILRQEA